MWKFEKQIQQVKVVKHLSFAKARHVETVTPPASGKSYAAVARVSTNNASVQADLTWPNTENKFKKVSQTEKGSVLGHQNFLETCVKMEHVSSDSSSSTLGQNASLSQQRTPKIKTKDSVWGF